MQTEFTEVITTEEQLRDIISYPSDHTVKKTITFLDKHCKQFIAKSPFLLIASTSADGHMDVSPKGDPAGFVKVLDDWTLAIPDRMGNRRADTFVNILKNGRVGLLFLIPGKRETLRVNGSAKLVRDQWLREQMAHRDKVPDLALVVTVEEAFIHCAKCMMRSHLWEPETWPDLDGIASLAQVMVDHANLTCTVEEFQEVVDESYRSRLY